MLNRILAYTFVFVFLAGVVVRAQPPGNFVHKKICVSSSVISFDERSIVPGSFFMDDISPDYYQLDAVNARLNWIQRPSADSIHVHYRVFETRLNAAFYRLRYDSIRYFFLAEQPFTSKPNTFQSDDYFSGEYGKIYANGSIGRIITAGNNQDAVVNSNLNLQLKGYLADSMELTLAISENATPIQPSGNTRDLRDLDRIFMQVAKSNWKVQLGDLDLRENKFAYLNFYKRVQGGAYQQQQRLSADWKTNTEITASIAKGKFNRQVLTTLEGNQGPYRLRGANNELFFQVLSGSEKVFVDGVRVFRGEDQDYVINYNTAEITFTPKQFITKDKRIQIEFEYTDRTYLNTQWYLHQSFQNNERSNWSLSFFSNQDSRNNPIDRTLDLRQTQFLAGLGDRFDEAFWLNASPDKPSEGKFLYRKADTLYGNNRRDSIYIFSNDTTQTLYQLSFSYVGPGKGDYQPLLNGANGKLFYWVQPDSNGISRGAYAPVDYLVTPKRLQVFLLSQKNKIGKRATIRSEWAISRYDVNLFSKTDKQNDRGLAGKIEWEQLSDSFRLFGTIQTLQGKIAAEWVGANFKTVERLRSVEFFRDWGLPLLVNQVDEKWANAQLALMDKSGTETRYGFTRYQRGDGYRGWRHQLNQSFSIRGWHWNIQGHQTQFQQAGLRGRFLRPTLDLKKQWTKSGMEWGMQYLLEDNRQRNVFSDSILQGSFSFDRFETFLRSSGKRTWSMTYFTRRDRLPDGDRMKPIDQSHNLLGGFDWNANSVHQVNLSAGFRKLRVYDSVSSGQKNEQSLLSRLNWNFSPWKGLVQGNLFYETGGGQEQKRAFSYLAVPIGQGEYTWIDYNGNGIEELNEFELAVFPDQRKYIRVFIPSNELVRAQFIQWNYRLDITPSLLLDQSKQTWARWISRLQFSSSLQMNRRELAGSGFMLNPLKAQDADSVLISRAQNQSHALFYNRTNARFGMELTQTDNRSTALLNYGLEQNRQLIRLLRIRTALNRSWLLQVSGKLQEQALKTQGNVFQNRNYLLTQELVESQVSYVYRNRWRSNWNVSWNKKRNEADLAQALDIWTGQWEVKYNAPSSASVRGLLLLNRVQTTSTADRYNNAAGFLLLESWRPGTNLRWTLDWMKRIGKTWEVNLQYEGRKPDGQRSIHTGRASVRAVF